VKQDIADVTGHALNFPLIADPDRTIAGLYDMIHPNASDTATVRSVFVIGPDNKVKLTLTYPASTGRNFLELLRVIDSLQLTANHAVSTPADWKQGEDVIIVPAVSGNGLMPRAQFLKGFSCESRDLRVTAQPGQAIGGDEPPRKMNRRGWRIGALTRRSRPEAVYRRDARAETPRDVQPVDAFLEERIASGHGLVIAPVVGCFQPEGDGHEMPEHHVADSVLAAPQADANGL
jgi:hypothetical protein